MKKISWQASVLAFEAGLVILSIAVTSMLLYRGRVAFLPGGGNSVVVKSQPTGNEIKIEKVVTGYAGGTAAVAQLYGGLPASPVIAYSDYLPKGTHRNLALTTQLPLTPGEYFVTLYGKLDGWKFDDAPDTRNPLRDRFGNIVSVRFTLQ